MAGAKSCSHPLLLHMWLPQPLNCVFGLCQTFLQQNRPEEHCTQYTGCRTPRGRHGSVPTTAFLSPDLSLACFRLHFLFGAHGQIRNLSNPNPFVEHLKPSPNSAAIRHGVEKRGLFANDFVRQKVGTCMDPPLQFSGLAHNHLSIRTPLFLLLFVLISSTLNFFLPNLAVNLASANRFTDARCWVITQPLHLIFLLRQVKVSLPLQNTIDILRTHWRADSRERQWSMLLLWSL